MRSIRVEILVALGLVAGVIAARLLPHLPNVSPVMAATLFGGFYFRSRWAAAAVPLAALAISDVFIGFYDVPTMAVVYGATLLPLLLRPWMGGRLMVLKAGAGSITASVVFFGVTNLAVWAFSGMYAKTLEGVAQCYLMALPFFQNTLVGDLAWSLILFGAYAAVLAVSRKSGTVAGRNPVAAG